MECPGGASEAVPYEPQPAHITGFGVVIRAFDFGCMIQGTAESLLKLSPRRLPASYHAKAFREHARRHRSKAESGVDRYGCGAFLQTAH